jgi:hypothetical protein
MASRAPAVTDAPSTTSSTERIDLGAHRRELGTDRREAVGDNTDIIANAFRENRGIAYDLFTQLSHLGSKVACDLVTHLSHLDSKVARDLFAHLSYLGAERIFRGGKLPPQAPLHCQNAIGEIGRGSIEIGAE